MNAIVTTGIVLARTDFQEADRILTILTPDHGKIRVIAKGVRKVKSKLAGGIELFSISQISFIPGKKEVGTLVSTRLQQHFSHIAKEINRTMLGYDILKLFNRITEDSPESEYFELLSQSLADLDAQVDLDTLKLWLYAQLLKMGGHQPNLTTDTNGAKLQAHQTYVFNFEDMAFAASPAGSFQANTIKLLRLCFSAPTGQRIERVQGSAALVPQCLQLVQAIISQYVKVN